MSVYVSNWISLKSQEMEDIARVQACAKGV